MNEILMSLFHCNMPSRMYLYRVSRPSFEMASQRFNFFWVVFTFYVFFMLEVAKMQTVTSSSSSSSSSSNGKTVTTYGSEINGGELGIKMEYDSSVDNKMNVIISYDTETTSATDFFQNQLTAELLQKVSNCGVVNWNFMPCGTSKFDQGLHLNCPKGEDQCEFDKIHACVAYISRQDQQRVGKFVICFFNNNKDVRKCVGETGLSWKDVDQCAQNEGANYCNNFYGMIHGKGARRSMSRSSGSGSSDATTNFKGLLCRNLANAKLQCDSLCSS